MAASASSKSKQRAAGVISCGNCLEVEGYLINPVKLQCGHIFCETCLLDHHKDLQIITCFTCKEETSVSIDELPSAMGEKAAFCDSCDMKGVSKMSAITYCSPCAMKFCARHEQSHGDCMPNHEMTLIASYTESAGGDQRRFCLTHSDQPLILGCKRCWVICCLRCLTSLDPCTNVSGDHNLIAVEDLADLAKSKLEPYKKQAEEMFEELSALVKDVTIQISQWDVDTEANVRIIHQTRDEQIEAIREKYADVEKEYVTSRTETKQRMTDFIETDAGLRLAEFNIQMKNLRDLISKKHPVDLVTDKEEIQAEVQKLIKSDIPKLMMKDQIRVSKSGSKYRKAEIVFDKSDMICLGTLRTPTGLNLEQTISVPCDPNAACHHRGYLYVGTNYQGIKRIDTDGKTVSFIDVLPGCVTSIRSHKETIYIITQAFGQANKLIMYNLQGQHVRSWDYGGAYNSWGNKICVVQDSVIVADHTNQRLGVYNLDGDLIRHIKCPLLPTTGHYSVAELNQDTLMVASDQGRIFTLSIQTGDVIWTSSHKFKDTAVVALNEETVLLSGAHSYGGQREVIVKALNIKTDQLTKLRCGQMALSGYTFDLCMPDDLHLLVPDRSSNKVHKLKIEFH